MNLLIVIAGILAVTALGGMYLLTLVLQKKETPKFVSFIHGALAATSIGLLIYYCFTNGPGPWESLVLFIMAAAGGAVLIYKDITAQKIPKWLAIAHGCIAVTGFVLLLLFIW